MHAATLLEILQLADSALPIGSAAHSFGLESLVDAGLLDIDALQPFLSVYLQEAGTLEAAFCVSSCKLARGRRPDWIEEWLILNTQLAARKLARESREGSAALGRRFLHLAATITKMPLLLQASSRLEQQQDLHLAAAFGLVAGALGLDEETAAAAHLQQSITSLVSCCQRLLPLGQTQAQQIIWNLKPAILEAAQSAAASPPSRTASFTPLLEVSSARHPSLTTRLFIS